MPMFYFAVISKNERVLDFEGTELPSLDAAREEAIEDARALMSAAILAGKDISVRRIEITDRDDKLLFSLAFADAISRE